tara:strand:- start:210 stop:713 length:504 start_codon:yes stop_codon:yes gene_type:complete
MSDRVNKNFLEKLYFGKELWEIIAWIIFLAIILWGIKQEAKFAKCYDGRDQNCGKEWEWDTRDGDSIADLVRRLEYSNRADSFVISRRITMIAAAGLALLMMWYFKKKTIPNIVEFIVVFVLVMGVLWFAFRYHESHYLDEITRRTEFTIQELKFQTGIAERPMNIV